MTPMGTHRHFHKENFVTISLQLHLIDHIRKQMFVGGEILHSLIHFFEHFFLIFHFKHVLWVVDRKVVTELLFSMEWGFKAQLYLVASPKPINLTQSWCTNLGMAWTWITSSITRKVVLNITPMDWLVAI